MVFCIGDAEWTPDIGGLNAFLRAMLDGMTNEEARLSFVVADQALLRETVAGAYGDAIGRADRRQ
jgi:hypothetical protein